jgi:hypothetical protein
MHYFIAFYVILAFRGSEIEENCVILQQRFVLSIIKQKEIVYDKIYIYTHI